MTQQQEMWIRSNMARRQAMMAAVARMRYSAAGGSSGSEKKSEDVIVPDIPMPEKTTFRLADGTVTTDSKSVPLDQVVEMTVGQDWIDGTGELNISGDEMPSLSSLVIPDGTTIV